MDLLHVAVTSLVSLAAMFLLTKLMGNKQVSQMNLFDYVIGISAGSANLASFLAGQRGRNLRFFRDYSQWKAYMGLGNFLHGRASWTFSTSTAPSASPAARTLWTIPASRQTPQSGT